MLQVPRCRGMLKKESCPCRVDEASILMRQFVQSAVDVKAEAQRLGAAAGISDQHVAMLEAGCVKAAQAEQALAGVKEIAQAMVAEAEEKQAAGKKEEK